MIELVLVHVFAVNRNNGLAMVVHVPGLIHDGVLDRQACGYGVIVFNSFAVQATFIIFGVRTALGHHGEDIAMSRGIQVKGYCLVRLERNQLSIRNLVGCGSHMLFRWFEMTVWKLLARAAASS